MNQLRRWRLLEVLLAIAMLIGAPAWAQSVERPVRAVNDPGLITTGQSVTPAGVQTVMKGRVHGATFGPGGELWVLTRTHVYELDWRENRVRSAQALNGTAGVRGLAMDPARGRPVVAYVTPKSSVPGEVRLLRPGATAPDAIGKLGTSAVGAPMVHNGQALAPLLFDNALAVSDLARGTTRRWPRPPGKTIPGAVRAPSRHAACPAS